METPTMLSPQGEPEGPLTLRSHHSPLGEPEGALTLNS